MNGIVIVCSMLLLSIQAIAFDSYEHVATANGVRLRFPEDPQKFSEDRYRSFYEMLIQPQNEAKTGKLIYDPQYILIYPEEYYSNFAGNNINNIEKKGSYASNNNDIIMAENKDSIAGNNLEKEPIKVSFGELIAFGGDFFGREGSKTIAESFTLKDFKKYIVQLKDNFRNAFRSITPYEGNPFLKNNNLFYLFSLVEKEYKSLLLALGKPGGIHFNHASSHSISSTIKDQRAYSKSYGYVDLLSYNKDHFGDAARLSYATGHLLAMEEAKAAGELFRQGRKEEAVARLNKAYAMDGFGSHFLTDLFSAGHLRTPRGPLLDIANSRLNRLQLYTVTNVGLMANKMHDEDNWLGLWVKDQDEQVWVLYGDGSFFDIKSADNREAIREALQASVDEVYGAFETGEIPEFNRYKALRQVGVPLESTKDIITNVGNHYPLFKMGKDWPEVRYDYLDPYTDKYVGITSLTGLSSYLKDDFGTYHHGNFYSFNEPWRVKPLETQVKIECFNSFNRDANVPPKPDEMVVLDDTITALLIDNSDVNFYKHILLGDLRPDGIYYVIPAGDGEDLKDLCSHAMDVNFDLKQVKAKTVVEIRAKADNSKSPSHPVVVYTKKGELSRLLGYQSRNTADLE